MNVKYYPSNDDPLYNQEVEKILPYIHGLGLDVGCGGRSINPDIERLDLNPDNEPNIVASLDEIPEPDEKYDFIVSQHSFEHVQDQVKTLKEWLRILKKGGYILLIHPDLYYTEKQKPIEKNPLLKAERLNIHYHEKTQKQMIEYLQKNISLGYNIVDWGEAGTHWSFYVVLRKDR